MYFLHEEPHNKRVRKDSLNKIDSLSLSLLILKSNFSLFKVILYYFYIINIIIIEEKEVL